MVLASILEMSSECVVCADSSGSLRGINREQSVEVIHLDVLRTFPTLGFFQEVCIIITTGF